MLNEVYAPASVPDLVWSRQKLTGLTEILQAFAYGENSPRVLLLYGPPGCGKLCSLRVLLQSALKSSPIEERPADVAVTTFHTCEASTTSYSQFLRQVLSRCSGAAVSGSLLLHSEDTHTVAASPPTSLLKPLQSTKTGSAPENLPPARNTTPSRRAYIVKFYGEPLSHPLHRLTQLFIREYEEMAAAVRRDVPHLSSHLGVRAAPLTAAQRIELLGHLQSNLIFFLHTTHDTHSEKVDVASSFPTAVLRSPAVELFHCTAVTVINMKRRLQQVIINEYKRRRPLDDSPPHSPPSKRTRKVAAGHSRFSKKGMPNLPSLLPPGTLDAIAAGSQGDVRQALLQLHWILLPQWSSERITTGTATTSPQETSTLRALLQRIDKNGGAAAAKRDRVVDGIDSLLSESATAMQTGQTAIAPQMVPAVSQSTGAHVSVTGTTVSETIIVSDDDEIDDCKNCAEAQRPKTSSSIADQGEKLPQNAMYSTVSKVTKRPKTKMCVLELLLDYDDDVAGVNSADGAKKTTQEKVVVATETSKAGGAEPQRHVLPTTRDEYIAIAHATGRILSLKYSTDEVLQILNVPPRKLLDYLANNQIHYFGPSGLISYASCATAASAADALRCSDGFMSYQGSTRVGGGSLAERTVDSDALASTSAFRLLDLIGLHLFDHTYRVQEEAVQLPHGFRAQRPPPFIRWAYPRLRDLPWSAAQDHEYSIKGDYDIEEEYEWAVRCMARLERNAALPSAVSSEANTFGSGCSTGGGSSVRTDDPLPHFGATRAPSMIRSEDVDIVREGLPDYLYRCGDTQGVVLDYYGIAPYILLQLRSSVSTVASSDSPPSSHAQWASTASASPDVPPRRTVFRFASATPAPPPAPQCRPCTALQLKILQYGRDAKMATLRTDSFTLIGNEGCNGYGDMTVAVQPLIPETDIIEEESE